MTRNPPQVDLKYKLSYQSLLGEEQWNKLHPAIQERFSEENYKNETCYVGTMHKVFLSPAGKLLAHLCRLIGTPLALYSGKDVPTKVYVYANAALNGITWDRYYHYADKPVTRVKSTKCINDKLGLVELVGFGFGMQLQLYERQGALYFESTNFFFQLGKYRVRIPDLLTPGKTLVVQKALDDCRFQFSLDVQHALLGKLFYQVGVFQSSD